jgi:hypothetical protein
MSQRNMESLPELLSTRQLEELIESFPEGLTVTRGDGIVTASFTKKDGSTVKIMSAASSDGRRWHVIALSGMIESV